MLLKNNVAVRSPRISPSPQREGGALQRLAAPCSVQPGWDCCLSTAASSTMSVFFFFFQEKQSTRQRSLGGGSVLNVVKSRVCYITAAVTQPCYYTQHRLSLLIKEPQVESFHPSTKEKDTIFEHVGSNSTNTPQKKKD